jgi:hypothetical protein
MWYYLANQQKVGPVEEDEIKKLIESRVITNITQLWTTGMTSWLPAGQTIFASLFRSIPSPIAPAKTNFGSFSSNTPKKYNVEFIISPPNSQGVQPLPFKEGRLPVIITNSKGYNNNVQVNINSDFTDRFISSLKESNLFLDAGSGIINFGNTNTQYHRISMTVNVDIDPHKSDLLLKIILIGIAGIIFFPLFVLYLLIKINIDLKQKITVEFISANGTKSTFTSEAWGKIKYGIFASGSLEGTYLGGVVNTALINSIINQIIIDKDNLGL